MKIQINGEAQEFELTLTVSELLAKLEQDMAGVAIAINQNIIPQTEWASAQLQDGDQVALFRAIAGG